MSDQVVIIGGGVVGSACAYYLAKAGKQVTIVDRGTLGGACSHGNCGYISPSHVLPLNKPGAIAKTLKSMLNKNAAFYLPPRIDLSLWGWLMKFARRCNEKDMKATGHVLHGLLDVSAELYRELFESELTNCNWEHLGLLFVFKTEEEFAAYAKTDRLLTEEFDTPSTTLDGKQLTQVEPTLLDGLAGAYHYLIDGHVRPDRLMDAWRRRLDSLGVNIVERCDVQELIVENGSCKAVRTSQGEMAASTFVLAAGAWSPALTKSLGCSLPIQPGKGYSITMSRPATCPKIPMILEEYHVAITPFHDGYRIGSTMEFAGFNETLNRNRLNLLRRGAGEYLREPFGATVEEEWFGFRPMSCDGLPFIGSAPKAKNVIVAAGHSMLGVSLATGTGKLVRQMVLEEEPIVDPGPLRVDRFG